MTKTNAIWASLPMPALLIGPQDTILDCNPAAENFLNLSAKSLQDTPVWDRIAVNVSIEDAYARARRDETPLYINDVEAGGGERPPMVSNIQIAPLQGAPGHMILIISPRELASRANTGQTTKAAAKSAIGMSEMLAHEIKNPLAGITGAAQLLSMNLTNGDRELTDLIVDESRRIVKLLEQVEQFGNLRPPERKPVNIHDLLDRTRKSAAVGFGAHMKLVEDYDPSLPMTYVDPDQLVQVFLNLLKNASEAADPDGGTIRIRTYYEHSLRMRRADGTGSKLPLQIEFIDDGPGLPPDLASSIFDPFVSGRENGTGLGLALVSKILTENDGWIAVDSVPGKTVFRLSLPVAPKELRTE
ncbi:MAG: ATP-binding protein [Pseudomonadota bacterium]